MPLCADFWEKYGEVLRNPPKVKQRRSPKRERRSKRIAAKKKTENLKAFTKSMNRLAPQAASAKHGDDVRVPASKAPLARTVRQERLALSRKYGYPEAEPLVSRCTPSSNALTHEQYVAMINHPNYGKKTFA